MRTLVIPDIHEDLDFLKYIIAKEDMETFDHVVLLGDYFDSPADVEPCAKRLQRVAGTIMGMKEIMGDKLHLLCGNHDLPCYALRPVCAENTGTPNRIISNWLGNTTCARAEIINELWDEAFWSELECSVLIDGWLFSHAGVHSSWWREDLPDTQARVDWLGQRWQHGFERIFKEAEPEIFAAGRARGGLLEYGRYLIKQYDRVDSAKKLLVALKATVEEVLEDEDLRSLNDAAPTDSTRYQTCSSTTWNWSTGRASNR